MQNLYQKVAQKIIDYKNIFKNLPGNLYIGHREYSEMICEWSNDILNYDKSTRKYMGLTFHEVMEESYLEVGP